MSGFAHLFLGSYAFRRGNLAKARSLMDQAATNFAAMGGSGWVATTKALRGLFSISEGDLREASARFHEGLQLSLEGSTSMIHQKGLVGLAFVASELGCHETAK